MKILALPRDGNPFQENLYRRLRGPSTTVEYVDNPTDSHVVNIALLPFVLALRRVRGYRLLHVHWVFGFVPTWARGLMIARFFRYWFYATLAISRLLGFKLVWTAHNLLPHTQVFDDDRAARLVLTRHCDHVIAMNRWVADEVRHRFAPTCAVSVIPHGVEGTPPSSADVAVGPVRTVAFFGRIEPYKGVDDLIHAFDAADLPEGVSLDIAGACGDAELAATLHHLASIAGRPVRLHLRVLSDRELDALLAGADLVALPFRNISTSGSLLTAMQSGRPVLVPDLPSFAEIPDDAVVKYRQGPGALRDALKHASRLPEQKRREIVSAAGGYLATVGWDSVAVEYAHVFAQVLGR